MCKKECLDMRKTIKFILIITILRLSKEKDSYTNVIYVLNYENKGCVKKEQRLKVEKCELFCPLSVLE